MPPHCHDTRSFQPRGLPAQCVLLTQTQTAPWRRAQAIGNSLMTPQLRGHFVGSKSRNPQAASLLSGSFSGELRHCGDLLVQKGSRNLKWWEIEIRGATCPSEWARLAGLVQRGWDLELRFKTKDSQSAEPGDPEKMKSSSQCNVTEKQFLKGIQNSQPGKVLVEQVGVLVSEVWPARLCSKSFESVHTLWPGVLPPRIVS